MNPIPTRFRFRVGDLVKTKAGAVARIHGYCVGPDKVIALLKTRPESPTWQVLAPEHSLSPVVCKATN